MKWSYPNNSFVKIHGKTFGSHSPDQCYYEASFIKGTALHFADHGQQLF